MKLSIDDVITKINDALAESGEPPVEITTDEIRGVQTDQLPPSVAEMEDQLFEQMLDGFTKLHGSEPNPETLEAIRFIARAEAVRRHTYRKLAFAKLDEFIENMP
ncbi:MAG: hypothetical protein OXU23_03500 [Candidatus Poribacteria bacterium]|nr:hypothetical protein [Candidatus Poribacteria bacterium]